MVFSGVFFCFFGWNSERDDVRGCDYGRWWQVVGYCGNPPKVGYASATDMIVPKKQRRCLECRQNQPARPKSDGGVLLNTHQVVYVKMEDVPGVAALRGMQLNGVLQIFC